MPRKKKPLLRCNDPRIETLDEAEQLEVSAIGCQIYFDVMQNKTPGVLVYKIPEDNSSGKIYANFFDGIQDVLRAAAHARFNDILVLKKMMKRFKIESDKQKRGR